MMLWIFWHLGEDDDDVFNFLKNYDLSVIPHGQLCPSIQLSLGKGASEKQKPGTFINSNSTYHLWCLHRSSQRSSTPRTGRRAAGPAEASRDSTLNPSKSPERESAVSPQQSNNRPLTASMGRWGGLPFFSLFVWLKLCVSQRSTGSDPTASSQKFSDPVRKSSPELGQERSQGKAASRASISPASVCVNLHWYLLMTLLSSCHILLQSDELF
jgi:hypothetical protein